MNRLIATFTVVTLGLSAPLVRGQQSDAQPPVLLSASTSVVSLPDAPQPSDDADVQTTSSSQQPTTPSGQAGTAANSAYVQGKQTKRILLIVPNFRSVSADQKIPPQSVKEKLTTTLQQSFDYSSFIFVGVQAGIGQLSKSYPEFHQGAAGYGRYYWHTLADQTDENMLVQFVLPAALHQDSRYYTLGHGNVAKRALYAFDRVLITRTDKGNEAPNISEIVGAGGAAGISNLYYPSDTRTWTKTGQRWLTNVIIDGATFTFQEFWPDINDHLFHFHD